MISDFEESQLFNSGILPDNSEEFTAGSWYEALDTVRGNMSSRNYERATTPISGFPCEMFSDGNRLIKSQQDVLTKVPLKESGREYWDRDMYVCPSWLHSTETYEENNSTLKLEKVSEQDGNCIHIALSTTSPLTPINHFSPMFFDKFEQDDSYAVDSSRRFGTVQNDSLNQMQIQLENRMGNSSSGANSLYGFRFMHHSYSLSELLSSEMEKSAYPNETSDKDEECHEWYQNQLDNTEEGYRNWFPKNFAMYDPSLVPEKRLRDIKLQNDSELFGEMCSSTVSTKDIEHMDKSADGIKKKRRSKLLPKDLLKQDASTLYNPSHWTIKDFDCHRKIALARYYEKRQRRNYSKTVRYECRKRLAVYRPRFCGRFVKGSCKFAATGEQQEEGTT